MSSVSEPLVKVLRLVDSDKLAMAYLYEAWIGPKGLFEFIMWTKGTPGFNKHMMLWDVIDILWTGMLHRPIHVVALFLNLAFSYKASLILMVR